MLTTFAELALGAFWIWVLITQILIPVWVGVTMFPFFRFRKLTTEVDSARDAVVADDLIKQANAIRKTIHRETETETEKEQ